MKSVNSLIPLNDMFTFIKKIKYIEDETVDSLLQGIQEDLSDKSVEDLKALNYFLLYKINSKETTIYPYEKVVHLCMNLKYLNDKDIMISYLLRSLIEKSLLLTNEDIIHEVILQLINFTEEKIIACQEVKYYSTENCSELLCALNSLQALCAFFINSAENSQNKYFKIIPSKLTEVLINMIPDLPVEVSRKIFASAIMTFVLCQDTNTLLEKIWEKLETLSSAGDEMGKALFYLCLFADQYIVILPSRNTYPLYDKIKFWELIQKGLFSEDSLNRKQSLYLLKRYIDYIKDTDRNIMLSNFCWDVEKKCELVEFWNNFFVLLEILEEKQIHLVTPALKTLDGLHSFCALNGKVFYSWLQCLIVKLLCHPSYFIAAFGIKTFCSIDVEILFLDTKINYLLKCFFKSLNNMFLFSSVSNMSEHNIEHQLEEWFTEISLKFNSSKKFEVILENLASISWSPIPLFFVIDSLSKVPSKPLLEGNCLNHLNIILFVTLKTQCIFIRSAIQCKILQCVFQLSRKDLDIKTIINFLGLFNNKESLTRGTGIWEKCVKWISSLPPQEITKYFNYCSERIFNTNSLNYIEDSNTYCFSDTVSSNSLQTYARIFVLINEFVIDEKSIRFVESIIEQFYNCQKRMYSCSKIQDNCLEFLTYILSEYSSDAEENMLQIIIKQHIHNLVSYVEVRLDQGPVENIETALLYDSTINEIFNNSKFTSNLSAPLLKLFISALHILNRNISPYQELLSLKVILFYYSFLFRNNLTEESKVMYEEKILENVFRKRLFNKSLIGIPLLDSQLNMRGKLKSKIMHTLWSIFGLYLNNHHHSIDLVLQEFSIDMLIENAFSAINEDGKESLIQILNTFSYLMPYHKNKNEVKNFIISSWKACFELRKSESFWFGISEWIRILFQKEISANEEYHDLIIDYAKQIMLIGEELNGLVDILMEQCKNMYFFPKFSYVLSRGLTFGLILRKDKRMEIDVCQAILKQIEDGTTDSFGSGKVLRSDYEVRLKALNLLLTIKNEECRSKMIACVIKDLLLYDSELTKSNKRYFNDSLTHRKKHKILQALLILENFMFLNPSPLLQDLPETVYAWVLESLMTASHQPSIRYQLEWLFIRLTIHYSSFLETFWNHFNKAHSERLGSMCSFISIAYHLSTLLNDKKFLEKSIDNILPWSMSQNFNIRLYAQVVLSKLWNSNCDISDKYDSIRKNQWKIYEQQGNMLINAKKMQKDFYFSIFHPIKHFTLKTIYWDLPRLSNISSEEWIRPDVLEKYSFYCMQTSEETAPSLDTYVSPSWIIKNFNPGVNESDKSAIQKKFIPWKGMFPDHKEEDNQPRGGLILVASLVEKAANLGGLARTCEVFAAKELVVSNYDVSKDKEFVSLSMTAEKHLPITEVKVHNLAEYLKAMKTAGYQLIGAEQTTGSISLTKYQFPHQCILLLGNEKEGIPPGLLPLLDAYIEIPQLGLLRSLNVHVTGAIFLWEYSKQNTFSNQ